MAAVQEVTTQGFFDPNGKRAAEREALLQEPGALNEHHQALITAEREALNTPQLGVPVDGLAEVYRRAQEAFRAAPVQPLPRD